MYSNPKCVVRDTDANIVTVINVRSKVIEKSCIDHYGENKLYHKWITIHCHH
jgi:hypothetical protein